MSACRVLGSNIPWEIGRDAMRARALADRSRSSHRETQENVKYTGFFIYRMFCASTMVVNSTGCEVATIRRYAVRKRASSRRILQVLREIVIRGEHCPLNVNVPLDVGKSVHLLQSITRILVVKVLVSGQYMFHQAVLVSGPMRAESALELGIDAAFEIVMPL